jgi:hypothetical protein
MALNRLRKVFVNAVVDEPTFGTEQTSDLAYINFDNATIISPDVQTIDDTDHISGSEEAGEQELFAQTLRMNFSQARVKPHTMAWCMGYAFGLPSIATGTPTNGVATRRHTITPQTTQALPSFTADALYETGVQKEIPGGLIGDFQFQINAGANRFANLSGNAIFKGEIDTTTSPSTAAPTENGLNGASAGVWLGSDWDTTVDDELDTTSEDLTSATDMSTRLKSVAWNFNNNIDIDNNFTIGGGDTMGLTKRQGRTQTLTLTFDVDTTMDWNPVTDLLAQTNKAFQIKIRGELIESVTPDYYRGLNLIFPRVCYSGVEFSEQNGDVVYNVTLQVLEHSTHGSVRAYVYNTVTTYFS